MRWIALALVLLAFPCPAAAMEMNESAAGPSVSILFGSVTPVNVDLVAGDTVHWSNDSIRDHTVTADDDSYDSGTLGPNQQFDRMFMTVGSYSYHCRLHPYIRGEVDVHTLLLDRPGQPAAPGRSYPISGRAALPGGTAISIEFDAGTGTWAPVADTTVNPDGSFATSIVPRSSGSYRAVTGGERSPAVDLLVLDRSVTSTARAGRVSATVTPASPGATVVLQLYLKERFGWWPVAKRRLGKDSRTTFTLRNRLAVSARVVLTLPDGATVIAAGQKQRLRAIAARY